MTNTIKARWDDAFQAADKTQKLTSATRSALKSAIAEHGLWSDLRTLMLQGRNTGQLTKDELLTVAHILEIRVDGLSVDAADNTDAATLDDATLAHNTVETATDASYTPSLDAAMTVARDAPVHERQGNRTAGKRDCACCPRCERRYFQCRTNSARSGWQPAAGKAGHAREGAVAVSHQIPFAVQA